VNISNCKTLEHKKIGNAVGVTKIFLVEFTAEIPLDISVNFSIISKK